MFDTKRLLDGFLGGQGRWTDSRPEGGSGGIGSLGGGSGGIGSLGGGSLRDVLGGLLGGGIGSLGSGGDGRSGGGGLFGGGIGSLGDEGGRGGGGLFGGGIGSLGRGEDRGGAVGMPGRDGDRDEDRQGGGMFGGGIGSLGGGLGGMLGGGGLGGGGLGGALGTAAAGGLLGSLLGGGRRSSGGLLRMGGIAVLGTLAHRAWKQWQESQAQSADQGANQGAGPVPGGVATPASGPWAAGAAGQRSAPAGGATVPAPEEFARDDVPAADGHPFGLSLIKAMIAAAKADGHLDDDERRRIFDEVERLGLDAESKGFVFQALEAPADPAAVAAMARTNAQKSEIYMVSRLVAEPDTAAERAYLDALAHRLGLASGLRQSLDAQATEAAHIAASGDLTGQQQG